MRAKGAAVVRNPAPVISFDHKRDAYGFAVRPQHLQRYREYANIYKEEEEERSERWKDFLERQSGSTQLSKDASSEIIKPTNLNDESTSLTADENSNNVLQDDYSDTKGNSLGEENKESSYAMGKKKHQLQLWAEIRPCLHSIEEMMSSRVKKVSLIQNELDPGAGKQLSSIEEARPGKGASEDDSEEEFYDLDRSESDPMNDLPSANNIPAPTIGVVDNTTQSESPPPWKEELELLVQGGVPMALRGEMWQSFVGVRARRVEKYYQNLLSPDNGVETKKDELEDNNHELNAEDVGTPEKWKAQIEKDLPRTFPGHPALDENGRDALRRILTAYARHNPSVGYCQAMNFFAGLLLLLMPEENAFWTLMGVLDDYFDGYYSEEMIESQVDQLVLEDLLREKFPKLANHLDYLGVQVACVTGPWFLTIYLNMLPWESVLRVWDVLLYEGNRVMLFRTALALMELYGPALVTTKDAGDAVTLLQSLAGSTFDSSQLVFTACMGFQNVNEKRLQELRDKHRPAIKAAVEERSKGNRIWRNSEGLASKLYGFKKIPHSTIEACKSEGSDSEMNASVDGLYVSLNGEMEIDPAKDLQDQVVWLKLELCKLIEEKRSAELRAEELETALMEMVKQDNRRQLSARVEQLEREVSELRQTLLEKHEQENAMLQILMRVEQEQKVTEDARIYAEQDAVAQKYAAQVLQEKYEKAATDLVEMEKRAVMAESMLEATLQYQSGQTKALSSPRPTQQSNQERSPENPSRKISLLSRPFGLGWRDKNKAKATGAEETNDGKPSDEANDGKLMSEAQSPKVEQQENANGDKAAEEKAA